MPRIIVELDDELLPYLQMAQANLWNERLALNDFKVTPDPSYAEVLVRMVEDFRAEVQRAERQQTIHDLLPRPDIPF